MAALESKRNGGRALLLLLLAALAVGGGRILWPRLEPAGRWPLLPSPWPLALPAPAAGASAPLRLESPGWQQRSLGNPARQRYPHCWQARARTPWDLILWNQQLYLGLGDSSNGGPTANAGPLPLLRYDPRRRLWHQDASLPEEAVERFVAAGDRLWIPGADARGSWRWGNVYRHHNGGKLWWQERRLPGFIHVHDLLPWRGALVVAGNIEHAVPAGLGSEQHGSAVAVSADGGQHWSVTPLGGWRSTALLPVAGQLYALEALPGARLAAMVGAAGAASPLPRRAPVAGGQHLARPPRSHGRRPVAGGARGRSALRLAGGGAALGGWRRLDRRHWPCPRRQGHPAGLCGFRSGRRPGGGAAAAAGGRGHGHGSGHHRLGPGGAEQ
jgi:hypothetical protein